MPINKLIFAHFSGKRTYTNTRKFISMIRKRLDGAILYFSSDGYEGYKEAILSIYGEMQNDKIVPPKILNNSTILTHRECKVIVKFFLTCYI